MSDDPFEERLDKDGFCWVDKLITGRYLADGHYISRKQFTNEMKAMANKKTHAETFPERFKKLGGK